MELILGAGIFVLFMILSSSAMIDAALKEGK